MSDTPEANTSAPTLQAGTAVDATANTAAANEGAAAADQAQAAGAAQNDGVASQSADSPAPDPAAAAAAQAIAEAEATSALTGAAPDLTAAGAAARAGPETALPDAALIVNAGGAPNTSEAPPAPTVALPAVEAPQSIMQKLEAILMPRGGVVEHTVEDLEHVCSWFHSELAKARDAISGAEAKAVAAGRVTLAEGRAILAERPEVSSVEIIEGTLHRIGGIIKRAL